MTQSPYLDKFIRELAAKGVEEAVIDTARAYSAKDDAPLPDALLRLGVAPGLISAALAQSVNVQFDTTPGAPSADALAMLDASEAMRLGVVPHKYDAITNTMTVLTASALDPDHEAGVAAVLRGRIYLVQVPSSTLKKLLLQHYGKGEGASDGGSELPAHLLDEATAREHNVVPLREEGRALVVAASTNASPMLVDDLRLLLGRPVRAERRPAHEVASLLDSAYGDAVAPVAVAADEEEVDIEQAALRDNAVIKVVNDVFRHALSVGASDIHIDPRPDSLVLRVRRDGVLTDFMTLPKTRERPVVARVKVLAKLNIADSLRAQDGRIRLRERDLEADMRVATQPTSHGEKVTIRLLQQAHNIPELEALGMAEDTFKQFKSLLHLPQGMILVTGPTGSGKSSTLFSFLKRVHTPEVNTMTIEDPVEYELEGINQSQINVKAGVTFPNALRAFVRHDPDIILVGEIRDQETAALATEAAITGHLVLSTVHTNDAPSTVTRLVEMGVEPFILSDALKAILAQRLVRRVCLQCATPHDPDPDLLEALGVTAQDLEGARIVRGRGCDACLHTGYEGRMAIHELLIINPEIEAMIHRRASRGEVTKAAEANGMRSLRQDGLMKAMAGLTTLEEVLKRTAY